MRIAANDKGIARVVNDLDNPLLYDPKSGAGGFGELESLEETA